MDKLPQLDKLSTQEKDALILMLWEENQALKARVKELESQISILMTRVKELEDQKAKDSHNSSKPPSSDGFKKKLRSLRKKSDRKSGGQKGHAGKTLQIVENPDHIIVHCVNECRKCGISLKEIAVSNHEKRQEFDIPPIKLEVTEHQAQIKCCPQCGEMNKGEFPATITSVVQYGERVKGHVTYLMEYQLLPFERASELMDDFFDCPISQGSLYSIVKECSDRLEEPDKSIKKAVTQAQIVHFDESGMRIQGKTQWLHVASTQTLTYYGCHPKRGKEAMDAIEILPVFKGKAMHDGWKSYKHYTDCFHLLCNAHHLRELTFIHEQEKQPWAGQMIELLLEIKEQVDQHKALGISQLEQTQIQEFEHSYQQVLDLGIKANPPPKENLEKRKPGRKKQSKAKNLLDRLSADRTGVLGFMYDFQVPFDNNLAERDIRMIKVKQKISGGFRSQEGASYFCRIRSYISTMKKQGKNIMTALQSVFSGHPLIPFLQQPE